jgi:hypothetical protein
MGLMIILLGIGLLLVGVLCLPSRIVKKRPEAQETITKITKYQGWIGNIAAIWGIVELIYALRWAGIMSLGLVALWLTMFIGSLLVVVVGVLLGFGMIQQNLLNKASADAQKKIQGVIDKVATIQVPLGYVSIAGGAWAIIYYIILSSQIMTGFLG